MNLRFFCSCEFDHEQFMKGSKIKPGVFLTGRPFPGRFDLGRLTPAMASNGTAKVMLQDDLDVEFSWEGGIESFSDFDGSHLHVITCGLPGAVSSALDSSELSGTEAIVLGEARSSFTFYFNFCLDFDGGGEGEKNLEHRE